MRNALVVEDDRNSLAALRELVEREGFSVSGATSLSEARQVLANDPPALVLTDLVLPDGSGLELLEEAGGAQVVLITGHASVDTAVEALRRGAADYLTKPLNIARLKAILANVARTSALQTEIGALRGELRKLGRFGPLVGSSAAMGRVYDLIAKVAPTDATVCIIGESGTGKEVVAQAVHQLSRRRAKPFVPVNCGAVAATLIESTLFGHEKGSFTGAERQHRGVFEQAAGGTLFLDEVTEMPPELQVRLLRALETGSVVRVGAEEPIAVDVRVVVATNRVPEQAVAEGKLREDLWYRLKVFPVELPPLRDRTSDVTLLAEHFLNSLNTEHGSTKRWTPTALEQLASYSWPGNVRELKNVVHRSYILADSELVVDFLPPVNTRSVATAASREPSATESGSIVTVRVGNTVAQAERRLIEATLAHCAGNKQRTAEMLGVSLKTLYNRLAAYRGEAESAGNE
ncbi:MAG: sigma-54-dependent transcriptional regulator [Candidatus Binatia bacterium]